MFSEFRDRFQNLEKERSKYNFNQLFLRLMKLVVGRARVEPILEILGGIAISIVIISGAWRISHVDYSVGDFAGFITAMLLMIQPARGLGSFNSVVQEGIAATKRIYELIDQKPKIVSTKSSKPIFSGNEYIELRSYNKTLVSSIKVFLFLIYHLLLI